MITVRPEDERDAPAVRAVHEAAFGQPDEAGLVDALRAADAHVPELCLVAETAGEVVGHVMFSRAGLGDGEALALAPVGVLPAWQRRGVGAALCREGLRLAETTRFPLVIVLGHAGYYPRFGFEPARRLGIEAPFEVPDESWMACRLPAYEPSARGVVRYARAFGP